MNEEALNTDLREEVLKYLKKNTEEPRPRFPTEYSALMYVSLGTLKLLHESVTNYNMWAIQNDREPTDINYFDALQSIVQMLESLAPQMQSDQEPDSIITRGFTL